MNKTSKTIDEIEATIQAQNAAVVQAALAQIPSIPLTPAQVLKRAEEARAKRRAELRDGLIVKFNTFLVKECGGLSRVSIELDRADGFNRQLIDEVLELFRGKGWMFSAVTDESSSSKTRITFMEAG